MKVGSDLQEKMLCSRYAACMALNAANFRSASATLPYMPLLLAWQPALPLTPPSRPPCMHCTSSQPRFRGESIHQLNYDLTRKLRRTQLALPHHMNVAMHGHAPPMNLRLAAALPPQPRLPPHPTAQPASYRTLPAPLSAATPTSPSPSKHCFVCLLSSCYRIVGCVRSNNATCISRISAALSSARAAPQTRIDTPTFFISQKSWANQKEQDQAWVKDEKD